jgi:hypothetical protein
MSDASPNIAVITCAVLELEIQHLAKDLPRVAHVEILEQGLHNEPPKLRTRLQEAVSRVENAFAHVESIVLGYGLCSRGVEGVKTSRANLIIPRAHDCITLLLGSKERYSQYVKENPGTYWYSPGWNKHHTPPGKERYDKLLAQYREKYGEDDAQYLMETEQAWFSAYSRATYVHLGVGRTENDVQYTRSCADWLKWSFDMQEGSPLLLRDLLTGPWDDQRFLVLRPGQTFRMTADERVIEAVVDK